MLSLRAQCVCFLSTSIVISRKICVILHNFFNCANIAVKANIINVKSGHERGYLTYFRTKKVNGWGGMETVQRGYMI